VNPEPFPTHKLAFRLLGAPEVRQDGKVIVGLTSAKAQALLYYLTMTRRVHTRAALAGLLWGESGEEQARSNLRKVIQQLREQLNEYLIIKRDAIQLCVELDYWVDASEFVAKLGQASTAVEPDPLQQAIALYRGDFLEGFYVREAPEFETWMLTERARLRALLLQGLDTLAERYARGGDLPQAITTARRMLELEPWREESHRQLMAWLAQNGQRSAAFAQYEICCRALTEELGVTPSPQTTALVERIQGIAAACPKITSFTLPVARPEFPLIGRQGEWQTLQATWRASLNGAPHFLCIAGEAGIGKTRLIEEALVWSGEQNHPAAYARCYAAEGGLAYAPVVDWLRSAALRPALEQLEEVWLTELARLLPELLAAQPQLPRPEPLNTGGNRHRFFEALARAITIRNQPQLLAIDDLQWCDRETLEWLHYLMRFNSASSLLLVGTYRVEEVERIHPLYELVGSLHHTDQVTELELNPLDRASTTRLIQVVATHAIDNGEIEKLYAETAGHPLFILESIRNNSEMSRIEQTRQAKVQSRSQVVLTNNRLASAKMQNVIRTRLGRLSSSAHALVEVAATVGQSFTRKLLALASGLDEADLLAHLEELWQRRVVRETDGTHFDFTHDRIREAAYAGISPVKRSYLHRQVAQAIEQSADQQREGLAAQLAVHYELGDHVEKAVTYFLQATRESFALCAIQDALHWIERGLQQVAKLPQTHDLLRQKFELYLLQNEAITRAEGWSAPQRQLINEQFEQLAIQLNDQLAFFRAKDERRIYHTIHAEWIHAKRLAEESIRLAEDIGQAELIVDAYYGLAKIYFNLGNLLDAQTWYERSMKVVARLDSTFKRNDGSWQPEVLVFLDAGHCYCLLGHPDRARQLANTGIAVAEASKDYHAIAHTYHLSLILDYLLNNVVLLPAKINLMRQLALQYGFPFYREMSKLFEGWLFVQQGNFDQGIAQIQQVIGYCGEIEFALWHINHVGMLTAAHLMAKQYAQGLATCDEALAYASKMHTGVWTAEFYRLRGHLLLGNNAEPVEVEQQYQKALDIAREQRAKLLELRITTSLCCLWQQQGRWIEAYQQLLEIYHGFTEGFDTPDLQEAKALLDELQMLASYQ